MIFGFFLSKQERRELKEIKQMKKIINAFRYYYFRPPEDFYTLPEEVREKQIKEFENFKALVLFKLVDQWKRMEDEFYTRLKA